jgi:Flp pilus assembly protein TadG
MTPHKEPDMKQPRSVARGESGQALVLLALALVGLLGFAGLALDGGNLYTEQRRAQAAADNAVMAAAYARMRGQTNGSILEAAAMANAEINGYVNADANTDIEFHWPPRSGPFKDDAAYMQVVITRTVATALAHLVYGQSPIPLTVDAVAHGTPQQPTMNGYALAAMKPTCDGENMISMQGRGGGSSGGTFLYGGGAFVNATCDDALEMSGGEDFYVYGANIDVVGNGGLGGVIGTPCTAPDEPHGCNYYPAPTVGVDQVDQDPIASTPAGTPPPCGPARNLATELTDGDGRVIRPGSYTTLNYGNSPMTMSPGIYCLTGGTLTGRASVTGEGVLLYLTVADASIDFSGNDNITVTLLAPTAESTGCAGTEDDSQAICTYLDIVVYKLQGTNSCEQNDVEIDFTGQASKLLVGLVYVPRSLVRYGGNGDLYMTGQTIAGCVKFNGNGRIEIHYDPTATYGPPPIIRLDE